jgi:porphobilinogen synthase
MQVTRLRRLRQSVDLRNWVSQTRLSPQDIILPYFVVEGRNVKREIKSMPGVYHFSIDNLLKDISQAKGIRSVLLFGIPKVKDEAGASAYRDDGIVQQAVRAIKKEFRKLIVITDVCLCGYTSSGHCGIIPAQGRKGRAQKEISIDNDETIIALAKIGVSHAHAGADFVAPSAMMDGQVREIREALEENGFQNTGILAYSAKYASTFYAPFRQALDSAPHFGNRKSYQMDYRKSDEALREIGQDIAEGADIVMVKPALAYLDIIYRAKQKFNSPLAAYNVSGEYSMIKKLAGGDKDIERKLVLEALTAIKRAGADLIISYFGKEAIKWLK